MGLLDGKVAMVAGSTRGMRRDHSQTARQGMLQNFLKELAEKSGMSADIIKKEMDTRQPVGQVGDPIDIAYGVLYLVSNEAKFVTGSELVIDGGHTAT
jgi:NAD(P)-dependent dehydrogenase (short-subunit alcohol dehydrogenase family)